MENLHDDTNRLRDVASEEPNKEVPKGDKLVSAAQAFWVAYRRSNDSIVDKYFRGITVNMNWCKDMACGKRIANVDKIDSLLIPLPAGLGDNDSTRLEALLHDYFKAFMPQDYKCDGCGKVNFNMMQHRLARLPNLLCISLGRFQTRLITRPNGKKEHVSKKVDSTVAFPLSGLDLTPYSVQHLEGIEPGEDADTQFRGPFIYDLYAVVMHRGSLQGGHYTAYVKDEGSEDPYVWRYMNDTKVDQVRFKEGDKGLGRLYGGGREQMGAYLLFYKRREAIKQQPMKMRAD